MKKGLMLKLPHGNTKRIFWAPDGDISAPNSLFINLLIKNRMKTKMKPLQLPKVLKVEGSNCSNYINSHHLQFQFNMYELVKVGGGTTENPNFGIIHKNQP